MIMNGYKPSGNFVAKVMADVYAYEAAKRRETTRSEVFLSHRFVRYALSAGGAILGLIQIIRIYSTVLSPALCR